jgi:RNA polymerase sigma factor (sigma-70 family)
MEHVSKIGMPEDDAAALRDVMTRVRKIAMRAARASGAPFDRDGVESDGLWGFLRAMAAWVPDRGAAFWTYADLRIRGTVRDGIRRHMRRTHGREVRIDAAAECVRDPRPDADFISAECRLDAPAALRRLRGRTREIAERVLLRGERAVDVARDLGLTEGRVSQLKRAALEQMKGADHDGR